MIRSLHMALFLPTQRLKARVRSQARKPSHRRSTSRPKLPCRWPAMVPRRVQAGGQCSSTTATWIILEFLCRSHLASDHRTTLATTEQEQHCSNLLDA